MALNNQFLEPGRVIYAVTFPDATRRHFMLINEFKTEAEAFQRAEELSNHGIEFAHVYSMTYINTVEQMPRIVKRRFPE